jgi:hypothetical protein
MANKHPNMKGLKPQKKGNPSLNPKGRPKGYRDWKTVYKEILETIMKAKDTGFDIPFIASQNEKLSMQQMIALRHIKKTLGKCDTNDMKLLQDRTDGLLKQMFEVENIPVEISSDDKNLL